MAKVKTTAVAVVPSQAQEQVNLLRGVEHGWKPTGRKGRR